MKMAELVFIPFPAMGHVVPAVQTAKLLVEFDNRVSTTVLLMKPAIDSSTIKYTESLAASTLPDRMRFIELPSLDELGSRKGVWLDSLIEGQKPRVKEFVSKIVSKSELSPDSPRLAGFVFDAFCTGMKDLAGEFGVPWYVFSSSGAAFLGCLLYLQALHDEQNVDITEFKNSDAMLEIPSFVNPMAARLLPSMTFRKDSVLVLVGVARRLREASGIVVNTFTELESHAVNSFSKIGTPRLYPVGPIVNVASDKSNDNREIMEWLDDQPPLSMESASDFQRTLPEGFLDRTTELGKVIGWAPQAEILAHRAIGGFVSHCGWNSILESIYFGVPIAAWPLYAEQQFNAFQLVTELGLGGEIKIDYIERSNSDGYEIVSADTIKKGIEGLMEDDNEIRKRVKNMSQVSKQALTAGGSSHSSLGRLIADVMSNIP
ncbi:anthocyanidin 3-O-glucosyltransferase 2-like [Populus alba x Populus x berolinensis]|nr:anthocyanidin 3-O-glucosyltransferase 2-like [Populus alba x Populus x berolinensis]